MVSGGEQVNKKLTYISLFKFMYLSQTSQIATIFTIYRINSIIRNQNFYCRISHDGRFTSTAEHKKNNKKLTVVAFYFICSANYSITFCWLQLYPKQGFQIRADKQ